MLLCDTMGGQAKSKKKNKPKRRENRPNRGNYCHIIIQGWFCLAFIRIVLFIYWNVIFLTRPFLTRFRNCWVNASRKDGSKDARKSQEEDSWEVLCATAFGKGNITKCLIFLRNKRLICIYWAHFSNQAQNTLTSLNLSLGLSTHTRATQKFIG